MASLPIRRDLSAAELRALARKESDARVLRRLLALAMALDGTNREEATRQAGMDRQTLRDVALQCRGRRWSAGSGAPWPACLVGAGAGGGTASDHRSRPRSRTRRSCRVPRQAHPRPRPAALRGRLLAQRHAGTAASHEAVLPQAPADPPQGRSGSPGGV